MSRILQALRQIESRRAASPAVSTRAPATPQVASVVPNPRITTTLDDPRLTSASSVESRFSPSGPSVVARAAQYLSDAIPVEIKPSSPEKSVTLPPPPLIIPRREFISDAQCIGQFDNCWSVTHAAFAALFKGEPGHSSTVHTLALPVEEPKREAAPRIVDVIPPTGEITAKYTNLADQLLGELRQGANHVLGLPALSYSAHLAGIATNLGVLLNQKKLGPVLVVETPTHSDNSLTGSHHHSGRYGERGLLEAMQGEPWAELIHRTSIEGLRVLHAGVQRLDMEQASMIASIESLWAELRAEFRFVLVSVPPGQSQVNDIVLCATDRIYVVLELGASLLPQTQVILRRWEELGGHAVGCIALEA